MDPHPAVEGFCDWLTGEYQSDGSLERIEALHGDALPGATRAVRLHVANRSYYEARVDLDVQRLEAGLGTESRTVNDAIEQMVLDNGGDLSELLADELDELGEELLPMEHLWDRPAFRYVVRLPLAGPETLADPALRGQVRKVLIACRALFQPIIDEG